MPSLLPLAISLVAWSSTSDGPLVKMQWARTWDGQWRLVLFDVPTGQNSQREKSRRYLRDKGFGDAQRKIRRFEAEAQG